MNYEFLQNIFLDLISIIEIKIAIFFTINYRLIIYT